MPNIDLLTTLGDGEVPRRSGSSLVGATPVFASETDASGYGFVVDEDNMASNSATKVPTQQSVKAYVDGTVGGDVNSTDTDASGFAFVIDEDDMASNSATKLPTQQSVKAYVDAQAGGSGVFGAGVICYQTATNSVAVARDGTVLSNLATSATNNVTVIQAAIDELAGTYTAGTTTTLGYGGGGTVVLSDQLWEIDAAIVLKYGVSLKGMGCAFDRNGFVETAHSMQGTVIAPTSGLPTIDIQDGATTTNRRPAILLGTLTSDSNQSTTNPHGTTVSDLGVWMRRANTGQGILICDTQYVTVQDVKVTGANGSGGVGIEILSTNSPDDGAHANEIRDCWLNYCDVGIKANGSGSTDGFIQGCRVLQCETRSVELGISGGGGGWQVWGCHFTTGASDMTGSNEGHLIAYAGPCIIFGNYFDTGGGFDVMADTALTMITGNYFKGGSNTKGARIYLDGNGKKSVVVGNTAQAATGDSGFVMVSDTTGDDYRPVVTGNVFGNGGNSPVGVLVNSSGTAQAEDNSSMNANETDGNTDPYYYGNRMVSSAV